MEVRSVLHIVVQDLRRLSPVISSDVAEKLGGVIWSAFVHRRQHHDVVRSDSDARCVYDTVKSCSFGPFDIVGIAHAVFTRLRVVMALRGQCVAEIVFSCALEAEQLEDEALAIE